MEAGGSFEVAASGNRAGNSEDDEDYEQLGALDNAVGLSHEDQLSASKVHGITPKVSGAVKATTQAMKAAAKVVKASAKTGSSQEIDGTKVDLSHCKSEGGRVNCADCTNPNSLCQKVYKKLIPYDDHAPHWGKCTTDTYPTFADLRFFVLQRKGGRFCRNCRKMSFDLKYGFRSDNFFLQDEAKDSPYMETKTLLGHPDGANKNVGGIGLKRILMHRHSKTNNWVADTYKVSYCIKCPKDVYRKIWTQASNSTEDRNFFDTCVTHAFERQGTKTVVRDTYQCTDKDYKLFESMGTTL